MKSTKPFTHCFCVYIETMGGEEMLCNIPTHGPEIDVGLEVALQELKDSVGSDFPIRIEQKMCAVSDLSQPHEDSFFVLIHKGPYAGLVGSFDGAGDAGVSVLDFESGTVYMVPKENAVALPIWDFDEEEWVLQ